MCGICGIAGKYDKQKPVIENMMKSIYHRGPDGGGNYIDEDVALGFRRLSIIDLDCGNQPMFNETGEVVIVFNGEIYNYQELTKELQAKGHVFANHSDTECLIHAYEEYHEKMLKKLRGMFGFAIWDSKEKTLFAARDFFGIKPFYYAEINGNLVFASEIKAILEYPEYKRELNEKALSHYLSFQYSAMDETFFKGIYKLNPGCCLKYKDGKLKVSRYFDPTLVPEKHQDEKAIVEEIKERVAESIEAHKISDVEVGSLLSGGVDSNYIAAQGHEIGYHGYLHEVKDTYEEENALMDKVDAIFRSLTGKRPVGVRMPDGILHDFHKQLWLDRGCIYSSNWRNNDGPFLLQIDGKEIPIVELPKDGIVDDTSYDMYTLQHPEHYYLRSGREMVQIWQDEFDGLADEGRIINFVMHPQFIGRPGYVRALRSFIHYAKENGAWITTDEACAKHVLKQKGYDIEVHY